jgi:UPF0755 protein
MTQKIQLTTIAIVLIFGGLVFLSTLNAPQDFPTNSTFEVKEGESLYNISSRLQEGHFISSALLFRGWISIIGKDKAIGLGRYAFAHKLPLGLVVAKFIRGPDDPLLSVTIPEGKTTLEVAEAFKKALPDISTSTFVSLVKKGNLNGYLFPSTYYPLPSFTEAEIISKMKATFDKEYASHFKNAAFPKNAPDQQSVISLAAILEAEAKTPEDMKIVSGILQKRLANSMRLQVDAAPSTYKEDGLPAIPIDNPGIIAMDAVFHPTSSAYVYYLTGKDGTMHYARNFEEHKKNIQKYLR